ncbi:MAG: mechanosensitive ion channel family protein [Vampirovibrionales bacterium]
MFEFLNTLNSVSDILTHWEESPLQVRVTILTLGSVLSCGISFWVGRSLLGWWAHTIAPKVLARWLHEDDTTIPLGLQLAPIVLKLLERGMILLPLAFALRVGLFWLQDIPKIPLWLDWLPSMLLLGQLGIWGHLGIKFIIKRWVDYQEEEQQRHTLKTISGPMIWMGQLLLWSLLLLIVLEMLRVNVSSIVAGLGIGGVAIALASQTILADIFAAFVIALDRPFIVGDSITVDTFEGSIEHIGLKTTRIRSFDGELILFPNNQLLNKSFRNYRPLQKRRIVLRFLIHLDTPPETVLGFLKWFEHHVRDTYPEDYTAFDRAHWVHSSPEGHHLECVCWRLHHEFTERLNLQQSLWLHSMMYFETHHIQWGEPLRVR